MEPTPHDKFLEDLTREAIEISKSRRLSGMPAIPAHRMHELLVELERRFTEAGKADPAIAHELCEKVKRGEAL